MTWLGTTDHLTHWQTQRGIDPRDIRFPEGTINAKQLDTLLSLDDPTYGRIIGVRAGSFQQITRITDAITEVSLSIGNANRYSVGRPCTLWLREDGKQIAAAVWTGKDHDDHTVTSYWVKADDIDSFRARKEMIETEHKYGFWSLGMDGAIPLTRQFIHDNYCNKEVAA